MLGDVNLSQWLQVPKNRMLLIMVLLGIACLIVGWQNAVVPNQKKSEALRAELKNIGKTQDSLARLIGAENKIKKYRPFFSPTKDISWIVDSLNTMAKDSGVEITSFSPQPELDFREYKKSSLNVAARGSYHDMGDFLARIESFNPQIRISDFNLQATNDKEDRRILSASLTVSVYHAAESLQKVFQ